MRIVTPQATFLWMTPKPLETIELAARTCYKSEDRITDDSGRRFVEMLLRRGHEAMIEHASMSYRVICDRGVTHEIVRHRLFSYAQESTRYCRYEDGIAVIKPPDLEPFPLGHWTGAMLAAEHAYLEMLAAGCAPQIARSVLPTCLKTEIVITGNFREWRHFFRLRTAKEAHPQMREIAAMILGDAQVRVAVVFEELAS